jgi:hypothetical protein
MGEIKFILLKGTPSVFFRSNDKPACRQRQVIKTNYDSSFIITLIKLWSNAYDAGRR